jgi:hypothetical protein
VYSSRWPSFDKEWPSDYHCVAKWDLRRSHSFSARAIVNKLTQYGKRIVQSAGNFLSFGLKSVISTHPALPEIAHQERRLKLTFGVTRQDSVQVHEVVSTIPVRFTHSSIFSFAYMWCFCIISIVAHLLNIWKSDHRWVPGWFSGAGIVSRCCNKADVLSLTGGFRSILPPYCARAAGSVK